MEAHLSQFFPMKPPLRFLAAVALAASVCAQEPPIPAAESTLTLKAAAAEAVLKLPDDWSTHIVIADPMQKMVWDTQLAVNDGHDAILLITGIKREPPLPPAVTGPLAGLQLWQERYRRPDKPEQITVVIFTTDGRRWVAQWVESKP